jgi:predicted GNAT family acetyltransferase
VGRFQVRRFESPEAFRARAQDWLLEREAEHNLILGVVEQLISDDHDYLAPVYLATIEEAGSVVGCAFRTPPHKLCITRMPEPAAAALVKDVGEVFDVLPAVIGSEPAASAVARAWSALRGGEFHAAMGMRIHALERVVHPDPPPPGRFRLAHAGDLGVLEDWHLGFERDTHIPLVSDPDRIRRRVESGGLGVWEDGGLRSMAAAVSPTRGTIRIGGVYTPPASRGRGYGSAVTAALSQLSLDRGHRLCVLYTDLANPTSNKIYRALGYEPVCDVVDLEIRTPGAPGSPS